MNYGLNAQFTNISKINNESSEIFHTRVGQISIVDPMLSLQPWGQDGL